LRKLIDRIIVFIFCFLSVFAVQAAKKQTNKVLVCYPELPQEYKKLKKIIAKIEKNPQDNYLYVLPVYNMDYPIDTNTDTWKNLSAMIQKATEEIGYAEAKDSTYCPVIEDIYKLKGIAMFYQKKYQEAYGTFDTLVSNYLQLAEIYIWLARTTIYLKNYEKTEFYLTVAEKYINSNQKDNYIHFHHVAAEYCIAVKDYDKALIHIAKAIELGSPLTRRLSLIAAQIYERERSYNQAVAYYNKVYQSYSKFQKMFESDLMRYYAAVHLHICEKSIEKQYFDSIFKEQWKEANPVPKEFEPTMVESTFDTSFFGTSYPYYFNDAAAMFFLNENFTDFEDDEYADEEFADGEEDDEDAISDEMLEALFENWETISVHIPKTDFTNMKDTIYLPLLPNMSEFKIPHRGNVVSRFGMRKRRYHYGTDLHGLIGDSILCAFDGKVRIAVRNKTYGNVIIVRHYNGLETFYAHCSKLLVVPNQEVKAGELIGLIGNTGRSRGPHLHFESRYKGAAFNPEYMIDFEKKQLKSDMLVLTKENFNYKNTYSTGTANSSSGTTTKGYYVVKSGENLSTIAKKYKTTVNVLMKMNGLKSADKIQAGQRLKVP